MSDGPAPEMVLSVMTVPDAPFEARVVAAAAAGFDGIGLRPGDRTRAHQAGLSDADLQAMLRDGGLDVVEIDVISGWGGTGEQQASARRHEQRVFELADALGGRHVTVVGDVEVSRDRVASTFADLCDRAAAHDLGVGLEYLPWTTVPDLPTALRIVEDAGRPNGRVVIDSWHHFRGADDIHQLEDVPAELVAAVQIDDAGPRQDDVPLVEETMDRQLPGDGTFDLRSFLRALRHVLATTPLCVEVISPRLAVMPPTKAVALAAAATRSVLGARR